MAFIDHSLRSAIPYILPGVPAEDLLVFARTCFKLARPTFETPMPATTDQELRFEISLVGVFEYEGCTNKTLDKKSLDQCHEKIIQISSGSHITFTAFMRVFL